MIGMPTSQISSEPPVENAKVRIANDRAAIPRPIPMASVAHQVGARNGDIANARRRSAGRPGRALVAGPSAVPLIIVATLAPDGRGPGAPGPRPPRGAGSQPALGRGWVPGLPSVAVGVGGRRIRHAITSRAPYPNRVAIALTNGTMPSNARTITPTTAAA